MAGKPGGGNPVAVSDIAGRVIDPLLRKRAGVSVALVQSWEEIAGPRLAGRSRPEKIAWPRRGGDDDPFEPATLVVACEGAAALYLQHETGEIIERANAFLGFSAIGRVKIVQKPVAPPPQRRLREPQVTPEQNARIAAVTSGIEDDGLRASLERLGRSVHAARSRGKG